jgi:hypothetical protein
VLKNNRYRCGWMERALRAQYKCCVTYLRFSHSARRPDPFPFFFPDLSSTAAARLSFLAVAHMSHYADLSGGARARTRVQGCRSSRNPSIGLDPVGELSGFPLVRCSDCGMAQVVEGQTQNECENHGRFYFKCASNSVSSLMCLPNLS